VRGTQLVPICIPLVAGIGLWVVTEGQTYKIARGAETNFHGGKGLGRAGTQPEEIPRKM